MAVRFRLQTAGSALIAALLVCRPSFLPGASAQAQRTATAPAPEYKVDPFWPKALPKNWILAEVSGVAVDSRDHVWIVHRPGALTDKDGPPPTSVCCTPAPPVIEFDPDGKVVQAWGGSDTYQWPMREHGI